MERLSVVIITYNEAGRIGRCLESVQAVADEVIVLDSGSTDETIAIAKTWGAQTFTWPFQGYIEQKNKALEYATNPFVLSLDADEALSPALSQAIQVAKETFAYDSYSMNRCTNYCGKFIRHGSWYPDRKVRLFNKEKARWGGVNPHDRIVVPPSGTCYHLQGDLLHFSYDTLEEHVDQNNRFSTIAAKAYFTSGKKAHYWQLIIHPAWAFVQSFWLRLGFLDGFRGYVIARNIAHLTFMKYYKLMALGRGIPPEQ